MTLKNSSSKWVLSIACVNFFALGLLTAAIGPLLDELSRNNSSSLAAIGGVFSAIFFGALLAQLVCGPLSDRVGQVPVLVGSAFILSSGLIGMSFSRSLTLTLGLALFAGIGHGGVDLATNVLIARLFAQRSVSALNLLNVFYGVGAFVGPVLVGLSMRAWQNGLLVLQAGAVLTLLAALPIFFMARSLNQAHVESKQTDGQAGVSIYRSPLLWMLGGLLLVYVGIENSFGGWTTTYLERTAGMLIEQAAMVTAVFWLALTGGRLVSAYLGTRLQPPQVLLVSLLEALAGALLFVFGYGSVALSVVAILLVGFGFGSIYPTTLAIVTRVFKIAPGKAGSVVAAMGSIGGMLLPWLQGVTLEALGPRTVGFFAVICVGLMGLMFFISQKRSA